MRQALLPALALLALAGGCGKHKAAAGGEAGWLRAGWQRATADAHGVKVEVDVPAGLPANPKDMVGASWLVAENPERGGPQLSLYPRDQTFPSVASLVQDEHGDEQRGIEEMARETLANGRLRHAFASRLGNAVTVVVWIPLGAERGLMCRARYYTGFDARGKPEKLVKTTEMLAWLDRFCASVKVL